MNLTIPQIIDVAKLSQAIASVDKGKSSLFGQLPDPTLPMKLYMERKAVEWRYDLEQPGITSGTRPTATITIGSVPVVGSVILVQVQDPDLGLITLAEYEVQAGDSTTTILADNLEAEIRANLSLHGFPSSQTGSVITITARVDEYAGYNGVVLSVVVNEPRLATESGIILTTENGLQLTI